MTQNPTLPGAPVESPLREFHAVADLFPLLCGEAFEELVTDIKRNGLREPILVDSEGRIVDGRNRYLACLAARVEPRFIEWQGQGSLAELALSLNLRRRHLDESQRALVAARLAKLMETEATKRQGRRPDLAADLQRTQFGRSGEKAGATVNVSPRLVQYAIKVLQNGCRELILAVETGALAVFTAAGLASLPEEEQKNAVAGGAKEAARKVRELRAGKSSANRALPAPTPRPSLGTFGVVSVEASGAGQCQEPGLLALREHAGQDDVVFLWVASSEIDDAMDALKARGFRYAPAAA